MAIEVVDPDGVRWKVRRRWMPRLGVDTLRGRFGRRFRKVVRRSGDLGSDIPGGCGDLLGEGIAAAIAIVVVILVLVLVVLPLLVAVVDVAILAVLAVGGVAARVLFRRPWLVDATTPGGSGHRWRIVGWRASRDHCRDVAQLLGAGTVAPGAEPLDPRPHPD